MGKTPAQENRLRAKKAGMSHDKVKEEQAKEAHEIKKLANKDMDFGRAAITTKDHGCAAPEGHERSHHRARQGHRPRRPQGGEGG